MSYINPLSENFILKDVNNSFISLLDYINPFSDNFILKNLIEGVGNIINYLNPFSENFFGYKITEMFKTLLTDLFVPDEELINSKLTEIQGKFSFVDRIKIAANSIKELIEDTKSAPTLKINIGSTKYNESKVITLIDMSWYAPYKQYGDMFISAFMYLLFIWRVYSNLPNIISGVGNSSEFITSKLKE